jgi:hypothetical protein
MRLTPLFVAVAACGTEPARPMAPELDPASTHAPVPAWTAAPNPLTRDVPGADESAAPDADPHHHHHHPPEDAGVPEGGP